MSRQPRIIHYALIGPNGEAGAFCSNPPRLLNGTNNEHWIVSKWLYDEVTCPDCRAKLNLPDKPSRGTLLRNNLEVRLGIAFGFVDCNYWNRKVRKPGEEKVNFDPDGYLAAEFLSLTEEFNELMKPLVRMMEKHEGEFGWPETVGESPLPGQDPDEEKL
jgi:hypothetical protein